MNHRGLHGTVFSTCPLNVRKRLGAIPDVAILILRDPCLENLDTLKGRIRIGLLIDLHITDRRSHRRTSSKRHSHWRHHATEAQRRREAGGYCQACDVLAHAHLLFLCFLLEFHLI
jgi:hypothetical protein